MPTIEVVKKVIGTVVRVDGYAAVAGSIRIDSSNVWSPAAALDLSHADAVAVAKRLADSGLAKGRVLYAREIRNPPKASPVVIALCLHIDTGLTRIVHTARSPSYNAMQIEYATRQLVECMKQVAAKHACHCLEWVLHNEQAAKACCKAHSFRPVGRRGQRYKGLRGNDYLLEFRF